MKTDSSASTWTDPGLTDREIWVAVAGLMLGSFLQAQNMLVVITALPTITSDLGSSGSVAWILSAYMLTMTAVVPIWGKLGDLWGRQRLYFAAILIFTTASVLCGLAQDMPQLIVARALQGAGGGGLLVLPQAVIGDLASPRQRGRYQSVLGANILVATLLGPLVGGFLIDALSWRWIFLVNVPLGALALLSGARVTLPRRDGRTGEVRIDVRGAVVLGAAAITAMLVVTWGGERYAWWSPQVIGLAATSAALFGCLVLAERAAPEPIIPPRLFRDRAFTGVVVAAFLSGAAMFGPWTLMPIFLQAVTGATATTSGLLLLPLIVALTITTLLSGQALARLGRAKGVTVAGMSLCSLGFVLYTTMGAETSRTLASVYMVVTGLGLGLMLQTLVVMAQSVVAHSELGVATGVVSFMRQLGGSFGTALALTVFTTRLASEIAQRLTTAEHSLVTKGVLGGNPAAISMLPSETHRAVTEAFAAALHTGFVVVIPAAILATVILALIPDVRLAASSDG